jgi:hypothetical protein
MAALSREFLSMVRGLSGRLALREKLRQPFEKMASNGTSSRELLRLFEADGQFYVDRGGPWLRLPLVEGIGREARGAGTQSDPFTPRSRVGVCGIDRERLRDHCIGYGREIESGPLVFSL